MHYIINTARNAHTVTTLVEISYYSIILQYIYNMIYYDTIWHTMTKLVARNLDQNSELKHCIVKIITHSQLIDKLLITLMLQ